MPVHRQAVRKKGRFNYCRRRQQRDQLWCGLLWEWVIRTVVPWPSVTDSAILRFQLVVRPRILQLQPFVCRQQRFAANQLKETRPLWTMRQWVTILCRWSSYRADPMKVELDIKPFLKAINEFHIAEPQPCGVQVAERVSLNTVSKFLWKKWKR